MHPPLSSYCSIWLAGTKVDYGEELWTNLEAIAPDSNIQIVVSSRRSISSSSSGPESKGKWNMFYGHEHLALEEYKFHSSVLNRRCRV